MTNIERIQGKDDLSKKTTGKTTKQRKAKRKEVGGKVEEDQVNSIPINSI